MGNAAQIRQQPSKTYKMDLHLNRIIGMTDGLEAVRQAAMKVLETERFEFLIYSGNYGCELANLPGHHSSYVRTEFARRIREALMQDDRIKDIQELEIEIRGDEAFASFTVVSIYGSVALTKEVGESV